MRLEGHVAVITGAASGIGLATARLFSAEGAAVVLADVQDAGREVQALRTAGGHALAVTCDVAEEADVDELFTAVLDAFGRVDILVNCAGAGLPKTVLDTSLEEWRRLLDVNLTGVFLCSRAAVGSMRSAGRGVIVNVASELALVGAPSIAAYSASKGGVLQLTRAMAVDHTVDGIRINAVCPGPVATPLLDELTLGADDPERERAETIEATLLKRLGRPEEIAQAILFLASDASSYVVGAALVVDGGITAV